MDRKCEYRNCDKNITGKPNKKFCNRNCKSCEKKYIRREKIKLENVNKGM